MRAVHRMLRKFLGESGIARKDFLVVFILLMNVLGWYYMTLTMMNSVLGSFSATPEEKLVVLAAFYVTAVGSGIVGAVLSNRVDRLKFLYIWIISGVVTSTLPALFSSFEVTNALVLSVFLGASFGFGMPSCLAYYAESTITENRGRIGGVILLITNLLAPILVAPFGILGLTLNSIIMALWRGTGLVIFFLKPGERFVSEKRDASFSSIISNRSFLLYFIAWFMFSLLDKFEKMMIDHFLANSMPGLLNVMSIIEPVVASLFILIAGLLCDWNGRKKIILSGFVALGVAYAIIGLAPLSVISWYLYFIVDGFAWGIFLLTFVLILWGDLSQPGTREKYYAIGSIPFFLSSVIPQFLTESFVEQISLSAAFSLASFFLFVAVMPLVFAPETLPEKKMELRRLRSFADEARKAKEKYERK